MSALEYGTVSDEDKKAMYALLIEHAAYPDEPGAWIAETARAKLAEMECRVESAQDVIDALEKRLIAIGDDMEARLAKLKAVR